MTFLSPAPSPLGSNISISELDFSIISLIASGTLDAAATSIALTGLDINSDGAYRIHIWGKNALNSARFLYLYVNADTTATNYYVQFVRGDGAVDGGRENSPKIVYASNLEMFSCTVDVFRTPDGYIHAHYYNGFGLAGSDIGWKTGSVASQATHANVTTLTITADAADMMGIGTKYAIYKIPGG